MDSDRTPCELLSYKRLGIRKVGRSGKVRKTDLNPEVGAHGMIESVKLIMMIAMNNLEIHDICHVPVSVWRDDRDEYKEMSAEVSITRCMR
jgi:hypothetical protein